MSSKLCFILAVIAVVISCIAVYSAQHVAAMNNQRAVQSTIKPDEIAAFRDQLKKDEGLIPDQAAVMTHVGYHFSNLWFAVEHENWPLADFYLGETRANVKWAVRVKPIRKGPDGKDFDLGAIAQALDTTNFTGLKKDIDTKDKARFSADYTETLAVCYSCHKTSGKPYLRPQIPTQPEVRIITMDPNAKTPQ